MEKFEYENLLHRAFSIFLFNSKYELLLQGENSCGIFIWKDETSMDDMEDVNSAVNQSCISYEEFHNLATKLERMETMLKSIDTKLDVKVESSHKLVGFVVIICCIIFLAYMANPT